ncbi:FKBP-type peptidyl-prolyl cis-trans isomerase [Porphyromonadaceae bacterium]
MKKISYALGLSMGNNFIGTGIKDLDVDAFASALKAVMNGDEPEMSYDEAKETVNGYFQELQTKAYGANAEAGKKFLEENKSNEGVVCTPSGLQYKVLNEAIGQKPTLTNRVKCHYHGTLIDGTVFDSSVQRGTPAEFGVNQVIAGWVEGLQLMSKGSKFRFFIPADLAYGDHGAGEVIAPGSALIFDVELIDIL